LEQLAKLGRFPPPSKPNLSSTRETPQSKRFAVGGLLTPTNSTVSSTPIVLVPPPRKTFATHELLTPSKSTHSSISDGSIVAATMPQARSVDPLISSAEPPKNHIDTVDTGSLSQMSRKRRRIVISCDSDDDDEPLHGGN